MAKIEELIKFSYRNHLPFCSGASILLARDLQLPLNRTIATVSLVELVLEGSEKIGLGFLMLEVEHIEGL